MQKTSGKYQIIRLITIIVAIFLLGISLKNFLDIAGSTTDENVFSEPFSRVYVTKPIPSSIIKNDEKTTIGYQDTIFPGSLILRVNDNPTPKKSLFIKSCDSLEEFEKAKILVFNTRGKSYDENDQSVYLEIHEVHEFDIDSNSVVQLKSAAIVLNVTEGGVSDRAGLMAGDLITKVNGKEFTTVSQADKILKESNVRKKIHYEILRANEFIEFDVKLARYGLELQNLLFFLIGMFTFFTGVYLIIQRPNLKAARLSGIGLALFGYFVSLIIMRNQINYDVSWFQYVKIYSLFLTETLWFPILFHSLFYFPIERKDLLKKKYLWLIPYITIGLFVVIILLAQIFNFQNAFLGIVFNLIHRSYVLIPTFACYFLCMTFFSRKDITKAEYRMYRPLKWSLSVILFTQLVLLAFDIFLKPYFLTNVFFVSLILLPFAYFYSIGRYGLLSLEYNLKKNIQYQVSTAMWRILIVIFFIFFSWGVSELNFEYPNIIFHNYYLEVLDYPLRPELKLFWHSLLAIVLAIIAYRITSVINKIIQKSIDKKYFRSRFDYKKAAIEFNSILAKNLDIDILAKHIAHELSDLVHLKRVGVVFFKNEEIITTQEFIGFNSDNFKEFCSACAKNLCDSIRSFNKEFRIDYLSEPERSIFQKFDLRFIVPIRSKEKILGAIILGEKLSETTFHEEDLAFLNTIASQISVSVENIYLYVDKAQKERIQHELEIARKIQLASLPQTVPNIEGLDISGLSLPAMEVGGDFYDYFQDSEDELTIILGDVSGKGTSAAFYMSKAQGIFRTLHEFDLSPKDILIKANEILYKYIEKNIFISAISAKIIRKESRLILSRAGHLPLYIYRKKLKNVEKIVPKGMVLGLSKDGLFTKNLEEVELSIDSGDVLLFLSDGVLEARNSYKQEFSENNMLNIYRNIVDGSAESIKNKLLNAVEEFTAGKKQFDDISIVVVKIVT
jgi:serine phosphatase RsbU (regulator of sigma subunit)